MPEITYIDENIYFTKLLAVRNEACGIYCTLSDIVRHLVSFVPDNPCTYFSAISLITSRHGSFICIIRTNIRPAGIRARSTNERRLFISHVESHFRYRVVSTKAIDLSAACDVRR